MALSREPLRLGGHPIEACPPPGHLHDRPLSLLAMLVETSGLGSGTEGDASSEHYGLAWMWPLIGALAFLGLSASEPTALLVVLVVLRSGPARGAAFIAGWVTALVVVATGAGFVARLGFGPRRGGPRRITLVVELVIGVALVAWATWYWLHNRHRAHSVEVPRILTRLTSISVVTAFLTGLVTATYPPAIVAGTTLLRSDASTLDRVGGLATFVVVGTLMVAAPVVATYVKPQWARRRSDAVFDWTLRHRRILLTTILIVVGSFVAVRAVLHLTRTGHHASRESAVQVPRATSIPRNSDNLMVPAPHVGDR